jgi:hypothetical protein
MREAEHFEEAMNKDEAAGTEETQRIAMKSQRVRMKTFKSCPA